MTEYTFTVKRSGDTAGEASVDVVVVAASSGTTADDFESGLPGTQTVTFADGEASQTVTVSVLGDADFEDDDEFLLVLANPVGGVVDTGPLEGVVDPSSFTATGVIVNDDAAPVPPPTLSIAAIDSAKEEGDSGGTPYIFVVRREQGDLSGTTTVDVEFDPVDTDADDFIGGLPGTQTVSFAPNETAKLVTIEVSGDTDVEFQEDFQLRLVNPTGGDLSSASSIKASIVNDDVEDGPPPQADPVISIAPVELSQAEGDSGTTEYLFTVSRTGDGTSAAAVQVAFDPGDTEAADFVGGTLPDDTVTIFFEPGNLSQDIAIEVNGDGLPEEDESFTLSLINPLGATLDEAASSATGVIENDDVEPIISIAPVELSQAEGDSGTTEYLFTVSRTGDGTSAAAVQVAFDPGDTEAADFVGGTLPDDTVTIFFEPGNLSQDIAIEVNGDGLPEEDESFMLSLINPLGATLDEAASSATGTILNDDIGPTDPGDRELILGTDGRDRLRGTRSADLMFGFEGDDTIFGHRGDDIIIGGAGSDRISGGRGEDQIFSGGDGVVDLLIGGRDSDTFIFSGEHGDDQIRRFEDMVDFIDFSAYTSIGFDDLQFLQVNNDAVISGHSSPNDSVILSNFLIASLDPSDFVFMA